MKKIIGILGGMGPAATVDAMDKIIKNTPANCDQEHIPVIAVSFPDIPDRTASILAGGESPFNKMLAALRILEAAGAECIIIPCNTAHYWYDELKASTKIPFLNIVEVTCNKIVSEGINNVAILATTGTIKIGLYQDRLRKENVNFVVPDDIQQRIIMESILAYKSGDGEKAYQLIESVITQLKHVGVEHFIMGCTEIPLILSGCGDKKEYIDATGELVRRAVEWCYLSSD
ncbi:aspartate/glutamate racemase family protein [Xenorhabdus nematophila]|uniref:aspartate/glutamate racemase family protein n=1 Tax=Xenorhabdus nematophila TaxID=628 RepID=UPI0005435305|nr:amino acid racemase [Xenorhabdus nematophila]CEF30563.1 putative aspartate racemase [Xenorhabdus nematophila str. Websteri]AYA41973.1 aspartate/glutamate racemase family protein [Xenorhabdus nematophila]MBA0020696.1 aspartate/glutamate racemase family protein [Xenorhabdus nematophila]MCB4426732.1 amino acid racemase [Xenorhabdus nematophila]QNJ36349.1 aspartate/glutamate racemase family protein [Xenorhabdus nematophila]